MMRDQHMNKHLVILAAALCLANTASAQDTVADFYRGKTIAITVGAAAGGGYDIYARLVARQLGKYIPGNPAVIVQNIPGAGGNKAASYVALQAPKDGTAIGAIQPSSILHPLLSDIKLSARSVEVHLRRERLSGVYLCLRARRRTGEDVRRDLHQGGSDRHARRRLDVARDADPAGQRARREAPADRRLRGLERDPAGDRAQ